MIFVLTAITGTEATDPSFTPTETTTISITTLSTGHHSTLHTTLTESTLLYTSPSDEGLVCLFRPLRTLVKSDKVENKGQSEFPRHVYNFELHL